jgi:hypothetical protein
MLPAFTRVVRVMGVGLLGWFGLRFIDKKALALAAELFACLRTTHHPLANLLPAA